MNRCLRCNEPCSTTTMLCDQCRALLTQQRQQDAHNIEQQQSIDPNQHAGADTATNDADTPPIYFSESAENDQNPSSSQDELLPQKPVQLAPVDHDQVLQQLNKAARRIAKAKARSMPGFRTPKASRLTSWYDVSADIKRDSTPLPHTDYSTQPIPRVETNNGDLAQKLWPWLAEEEKSTTWHQQGDPLQDRRFPSNSEIRRIEEDDLAQIVQNEDEIGEPSAITTVTMPQIHPEYKTQKIPAPESSPVYDTGPQVYTAAQPPQRHLRRRISIIFTILAILAVLAIVIDSVLFSFVLHPSSATNNATNVPPSLSLSKNVVVTGEKLTISISHFSANAQLLLTHDIDEAVLTTNQSRVTVDQNGTTKVTIIISGDWGSGQHSIQAQDIVAHYTANATLRIDGETPLSSKLTLSDTTLNFGPDLTGANTLQIIRFSNAGNGLISWTATSDQPWLSISPKSGLFSAHMQAVVGASRDNLLPGDYDGCITITPNGEPPHNITVHMTVNALPANAGAVLAVAPATISFTSVDGMDDPIDQKLTIHNPGTRSLSWQVDTNPATSGSDNGNNGNTNGPGFVTDNNWLTLNQNSGVLDAHGQVELNVSIHARRLLPGVYRKMLSFSNKDGSEALNAPQKINISLTVQPRCTLVLNTGTLAFTAIAGHGTPSTQSISLTASSSCSGTVSWNAITQDSWLQLMPNAGRLQEGESSVITVGVNIANLKPGDYTSNISIATGKQSSQTVTVQLTVQAPPPPSAPILNASSLSLNFSMVLGQPRPTGQAITLTNTGGSSFQWTAQANTQSASWLNTSPASGSVAPGKNGQVNVDILSATLTPGTYSGQIQINAVDNKHADAGGSPQIIAVSLVVYPPCTFAAPSSKVLAFSAIQGDKNPTSQSLALTASGSCNWPLNWSASVVGTAPGWLKYTPSNGAFSGSSQVPTLTVTPDITNLSAGTYQAVISIKARDSGLLDAQGSPQTVTVTLNILPPCTLLVSSANLTFNVIQGATATAQNLTINSTGSCIRPLSWSAVSDASGNGWLVLSNTSGADSGSGSTVGVNVNAAQLTPGNYSSIVTISSAGAGQGSPQTVTVTVNVSGFTLSGTVNSCSPPATTASSGTTTSTTCTSPQATPGATVTLVNSANKTVGTAIADATGGFSFANLASGSYTINASWTDTTSKHYSGTVNVTVTTNQNVSVNMFADT